MPLLVPAEASAFRRNNFNTIRLAMALLVVWSHGFAFWYGTEASEPISRVLNGTYNAGNLAVLVFFTISGFLITISWERSPTSLAYLRKRVARIYPGYLVAITLCSVAIVPLASSRSLFDFRWQEWGGLASNLLLRNYFVLSDAFGGQPLNGSLWSIPYEFWCYIGLMALGLAGVVRRRGWLVAGVLIVMAVRCWCDLTGRRPGGGWFEFLFGFQYLWMIVLPSFLWGMVAYRYRDRLPRHPVLLLAVVAATIGAAHLPIAPVLQQSLTRLLFPPTLAYATLYVAFHPRWQWPDAAARGDFSYGAYLYAFPIQRILHPLLAATTLWTFIAASCALTLMAGVLSWFLVERWFTHAPVSRRASRRSSAIAADAAG